MKIAGVRFRDNSRIYDFDATGIELFVGDPVIVESDRGMGFARVVRLRDADELPPVQLATEEQQQERNINPVKPAEVEEEIEIDVQTPGDVAAAAAAAAAGVVAPAAPAPQQAATERPRQQPKGHRKVVRKATDEDLRKEDKNRSREAEAFKACQDMIAERELPMKLIRSEFSFDAARVTFYFFSENRIDFRELVKDLAHKLRSRIEMRQVGVRDVARIIGGFGPCGRELCCSSYLRGFEPVSIRMAKKQDMVLNPAKISGVCGRLLCCLSYEFPVYDAIKKDIAEMKETAVREKRAVEESRLAELRQEAEERRQAEELSRRDDERRRQEQKREKQPQPQPQQRDGRKPEKKKEGGQEQKQKPPQEQQREKQKQPKQQQQKQNQQQRQQQKQRPQQQPQQKPQAAGPVVEGQEPQPQDGQTPQQGEKTGGGKRRRRFWRDKKKKKGGETPTPPAGG